MAHKHAHLMMQYAHDAAEHDTPWGKWQFSTNNGETWEDCAGTPAWDINSEYRHKPKKTVFERLVVPTTDADEIELHQDYYVLSNNPYEIWSCCNHNPAMLRTHIQKYHVYTDMTDAENALAFLKHFIKK